MLKLPLLFLVLVVASVAVLGTIWARPVSAQSEKKAGPDISILWTSADRDVALNMVFMYGLNAKRAGWANEVELIVWGPSAKLLAEDEEIQAAVKGMGEVGVILKACRACADRYEVSDDLEILGVEVKYMGTELTERIASERWNLLTF